MIEENEKDAGIKRKLEEVNEIDEQISAEKSTDENPVKKVKSSDNEETKSSNDANGTDNSDLVLNIITSSNSSSDETEAKQEKITTLTSGFVYRIQSPELGDFVVEAGSMGRFRVKAASLVISDRQGTVVFPVPNSKISDGEVVEVKDNLNSDTTVTVTPAPPKKNWIISTVLSVFTNTYATEKDDPPLRILGFVDLDIIINYGIRSAVITGTGRDLTFNSSGIVTVEGNLRSLQKNGTGTVKVNGKLKLGIWQTSRGSIVVTKDVIGDITNSGGGSIEVMGMHGGTVINDFGGYVAIGTGPNNGGVRLFYRA